MRNRRRFIAIRLLADDRNENVQQAVIIRTEAMDQRSMGNVAQAKYSYGCETSLHAQGAPSK